MKTSATLSGFMIQIPDGVLRCSGHNGRQAAAKARPFVDVGCNSQEAAVRLDNCAADGEPQPQALRFGGEKRLEKPLRGLPVDPCAGVRHPKTDAAFAIPAGFNHYEPRRKLVLTHSLHGV